MSELSTPPISIHRDCDPAVQQARQDTLDALYLLDGRDNPDHPMDALYTGLAQQYASEDAA